MDPVDPAVTFALALVGTITGVATAAVEVARTIRDRARVKLHMTSHSSASQSNASVSVEVLNTGRRALTIREVGIYPGSVRIVHKSQKDGIEREGRSDVLFVLADEPFVLEPGTLVTFRGHLDEFFNVGLHADRLVRSYAVDLGRRWHWGDVESLMRNLINHGHPVPSGTPDRLLGSAGDPGPAASKPRRGLRGSRRRGERLIVRLDSASP